ncbi:hypothetical protein RIF29_03585 [Crotalaria pallida]|uniref:Growth-regulating factor n=1 Tax=Crotalaria pallida TaxID=3830 RepID=A0AAN9J044_CROPI
MLVTRMYYVLRTQPIFFKGGGSGPQKKNNVFVVVGDDEEKKRINVVVVKEEKNGVGFGAQTEPQPEAINNPLIKAAGYYNNKCCLFTEAQRLELFNQVFIFNYFACHLPILHHHLAVPAAFSSYMPGSEYSHQGFDYGSSMVMDPEPRRCRRTDGKRWRCSREVVPDQKYCEKHMHRGCNRSRKLVETYQHNSPLTTKPSGKLQTKLTSSNKESTVSNPNPLGTQPIDTSSCTYQTRNHSAVNTSSANSRLKNIIGSADYHTSFSPAAAIAAPKVTTFSNITSVPLDNRSGLNICKKENQAKCCMSYNVGVKSGAKGSIIYDGNSLSSGIGFSPRSVLLGNIGEFLVAIIHTSVTETVWNSNLVDAGEQMVRSGGARVLLFPGRSIVQLMHRGSKRRFAEHEPAATDSSVTVARLPYSNATTNIQGAHCSFPNTNLSMSIPASAASLIMWQKKSPSSCDSDTTITDTINEYSYASS